MKEFKGLIKKKDYFLRSAFTLSLSLMPENAQSNREESTNQQYILKHVFSRCLSPGNLTFFIKFYELQASMCYTRKSRNIFPISILSDRILMCFACKSCFLAKL